MDLPSFKKRLEDIVPGNWPFSDEETEEFLRKCQKFSRSLEVLAPTEKLVNTGLSQIDQMILLFKEIVGIEMLIKDRGRKPLGEQFSLRSSWLIATREEQLDIIQNHLGTLYGLRGSIVHELSLPKDRPDFDRYFRGNLKKAISIANKYHHLILLRHIVQKEGIISKSDLVRRLKQARKYLRLELPLSIYDEAIANELTQITGIPSSYSRDRKSPLSLPSIEDCYFLGINSYGGLSKSTHSTIEAYKNFKQDDERIIPNKPVWEKFRKEINREIRKIREKQYSYVRIVPKAHLSILFYLGYRFYRRRNIVLLTDFNGKEIELNPLKEFVDPNDHWSVRTNGLKLNNSKVVVILNVTRPLKAKVDADRSVLELQEIPQIVFNCRCSNSKMIPNSQCISSEIQIKQACRALELYFTQLQETHLLDKVHIFVRAPSAMIILLGMHFRLAGLNAVLYEYGKRSVDDDSKHFYKVLECEISS